MLNLIFPSREQRWALSRLNEISAKHPVFFDPEIRSETRKKFKTSGIKEGRQRGLSTEQITAIALFEASHHSLFFGDGNFVYRGNLTSKGRDRLKATTLALELLVELMVLPEEERSEKMRVIQSELRSVG